MTDPTMPRPPEGAGDDVLREALRTEADRVTPTPDWANVQSRATHNGSTVVWAVAAAVVVLLAVITVPRLLDRDDPILVAPVAPTEVPTAPSAEPATPAPTPAPAPSPTTTPPDPATGEQAAPTALPAGEALSASEIVAVVHTDGPDGTEQDLVVTDAAGTTVRTLMDGVHTAEGGIYQLSLSPDGRTVVYALGTSACTQAVEAIAADGSSPATRLADGDTPAVSPDGRWLALDPGDGCMGESLIELRPVAGGEILRFGTESAPLAGLTWDHPDEEFVVGEAPGPQVGSMAFLDDQTLLYTVTGGDDDGSLWALNLATGRDRRVDPAGGGGTYSALHHSRVGEVVAIHQGPDGWDVLVINAELVIAAHSTLGGDQAYQASVSDSLGVVHTRGSGVAGLVVGDQQVRTDVHAALVGPPADGSGATGDLPPILTGEEVDVARGHADAFLDALREGDLAAAAELWSGYPDVNPSQPGAVEAELRRVVDRADWPPLTGAVPDDVVVTPAWTFTEPTSAVVTYVFGTEPGERTSLSFVVSLSAESDDGLGPIVRVPGWTGADRGSLDGTVVPAGTAIELPGLPLEGAAFAHVDGRPVPVEIDYEALVVRVTLPADVVGEVVLTLSAATPEAPTAESHAITVTPP